jgi:hypothetical protein
MSNEIQVNDVGTRFLLTITDNGLPVNLTDAIQVQVVLRNPNDNIFYKQGVLLNSGINGQVYYDTVEGDIVEAGLHKIQATVFLPSGVYHTNIYSFQVNCNL